MHLVTPTEVEEFVRGLDSAESAETEALIASADALLAAWCGWGPHDGSESPTLTRGTITRYYDGTLHPRELVLEVPAVASVTSVATDPDGDHVTPTILDTGDYLLTGGSLWMRAHAARLPSGRRSIRVVMEAGFDPENPPAHVRTAMLLTVRDFYKRKSVEGLPNGRAISPDSPIICEEAKTLLMRHRGIPHGR